MDKNNLQIVVKNWHCSYQIFIPVVFYVFRLSHRLS